MKKYLRFFPLAYGIQMAYRGTMALRALRDSIDVVFYIVLWAALYQDKTEIAGFTFSGMVTYYILVKIIDQLYSSEHARIIMVDIKAGNLSNFLTKPLSYFLYSIFYRFGLRLARVSASLVLVAALFILLPKYFVLPSSLLTGAIFLVSATLSWLMWYQVFFIIGTLSFWFSDISSLRTATDQVALVLGGSWVPLSLFPERFQFLISILPFKYLYFNLVNIYQGKIPQSELGMNILIQVAWTIALGIICFVLWKKGIKNYSAYGN